MAECQSCSPFYTIDEWSEHRSRRMRKSVGGMDEWTAKTVRQLQDWDMPRRIPDLRGVVQPAESVGTRFYRLAADWSANTRHISSVSDLASHPSYQAIINLGWEVVPLLLSDLKRNKRFWFPALFAITKVRPFDPSDAGNSRRMTEAWIMWGKRKGLI